MRGKVLLIVLGVVAVAGVAGAVDDVDEGLDIVTNSTEENATWNVSVRFAHRASIPGSETNEHGFTQVVLRIHNASQPNFREQIASESVSGSVEASQCVGDHTASPWTCSVEVRVPDLGNGTGEEVVVYIEGSMRIDHGLSDPTYLTDTVAVPVVDKNVTEDTEPSFGTHDHGLQGFTEGETNTLLFWSVVILGAMVLRLTLVAVVGTSAWFGVLVEGSWPVSIEFGLVLTLLALWLQYSARAFALRDRLMSVLG